MCSSVGCTLVLVDGWAGVGETASLRRSGRMEYGVRCGKYLIECCCKGSTKTSTRGPNECGSEMLCAFDVHVYLKLQESHEISLYPFVFFVVVFRRRFLSTSISYHRALGFSAASCSLDSYTRVHDECLRATRIHNTDAH